MKYYLKYIFNLISLSKFQQFWNYSIFIYEILYFVSNFLLSIRISNVTVHVRTLEMYFIAIYMMRYVLSMILHFRIYW